MSGAPTPQRIRVALVEDDDHTRARLVHAIEANPALQLVCAAATGAEILAWLPSHEADVLLVDLGLPDVPGLDVIHRCCLLRPDCEVMVISMFGDEANILRAIENGARGYLLKDGTEAGLASHVLDLRAGGSPMTPIIARQLLVRWAGQGTPAAASGSVLSPREREVLDLLARGFTYTETAQHLGIGVSTVHTHVNGIYRKLDVHNKAEAVFEARQQGWLA